METQLEPAPGLNDGDAPATAAANPLGAKHLWILLVGGLAGLLYWLLRSCSLDEWDSVLFAQGVLHFDLVKHQPHPPGYPLYIFFGKLLTHLGFSVQQALVTISAVTGGVFIATWLAIVARSYGQRLALPFIFAVAGIIGVSLTAGKALTDMPASAFMVLQLWFCLQPTTKRYALIAAAVCGGIAAGFRPQNVGITLLLVLAGGWLGKRSWKDVSLAFLVFALTCFAWLLPMMAVQAEAMGTSNWLAYFDRVNDQWTSRFNRPNTFIGAGDWSVGFLSNRFAKHFAWSWFYLGMGLDPRTIIGVLGYAIIAAAFGAFLFLRKSGTGAARLATPGFWKWQLLWAVPYILTIFICLPADPRYYVPVFPLLILLIMLGLDRYPVARGWMQWGLGILAWAAAIPLLWQMHREMPPPVQAVEWLRTQVPEQERKNVWLWLNDSHRHAVWYAPEFANHSIVEDNTPPPGTIVYSDLKDLPKRLGKFRNAVEVARFSRSKTIHRKHELVVLYRVEYDESGSKARKKPRDSRAQAVPRAADD